ncbi:MAG: 4'-phosphopantetheinyl transferase superfamily protein [Thermosynechococcaceae cyanobacterium MS004]|nr:4'-phosphopantetheinyl transferase superfamily protein [Thermosynechococcaceae cyanobacterium MS004]
MALWLSPPSNLSLTDDEIHLWKAPLSCFTAQLQALAALLSPDEQQRAARFCFDKDRHQYWASRGLLRLILATYLCEQPRALRFIYGPYGKPALDPERHAELRFNLSHSRGLALFAIARRYAVGVDLEFKRPDLQWQQIVEQFFSAQECRTLQQLPAQQQLSAFFDGWTRKEAYLKAKGQGLSLPLNQVEVSLSPDQPAALLRTPDSQSAQPLAQQVVLQGLDLGEEDRDNYSAAIAIETLSPETLNPTLKYWQIPPGWSLELTDRSQSE